MQKRETRGSELDKNDVGYKIMSYEVYSVKLKTREKKKEFDTLAWFKKIVFAGDVNKHMVHVSIGTLVARPGWWNWFL